MIQFNTKLLMKQKVIDETFEIFAVPPQRQDMWIKKFYNNSAVELKVSKM